MPESVTTLELVAFGLVVCAGLLIVGVLFALFLRAPAVQSNAAGSMSKRGGGSYDAGATRGWQGPAR